MAACDDNFDLIERIFDGFWAAGLLTLRLTLFQGGFLWFTAGAAWMWWFLKG